MVGKHFAPGPAGTHVPTLAAIYVRAATALERGLQISTCLGHAQRHGLAVTEELVFVEEDAATEAMLRRPAFTNLMQALYREAFATLLVTSADILFRSAQDLDGFGRILAGHGVTLQVASGDAPASARWPSAPQGQPGPATWPQPGAPGRPAPGSTAAPPVDWSALGAHARGWAVQHLANGDEQIFDQATGAVRRGTQFLAQAAAASLGRVLPPAAPTNPPATPPSPNPPVIILGPATSAQTGPSSANATPEAPLGRTGPAEPFGSAAGTPTPVPGSPAQQGYGRPAPITQNLLPRLKNSAHQVVMEHADNLAERRVAALTGSHLDKAAGDQVNRIVIIVQATGRRILTFFTIGLELTRPFDGYGPGDVVVVVEGVVGRTIDGLKLSRLERIMYIVAAVLPFVSGRWVVAAYRKIEPWTRGENSLSGWQFLMKLLPQEVSALIPDPEDARYPRSLPQQALRAIAGVLWVPFIAYFAMIVTTAVRLVIQAGGQIQALFQLPALLRVFLLDPLLPPAHRDPGLLLGVLAVVLLGFLGALVLDQAARLDRICEALVLGMRIELPRAHGEATTRVHNTLRQRDTTMNEKLTFSFQHLHDVSLKTARAIMRKVSKQEAWYLGIAVALALLSVVTGVVLAIVGIV